MQCRECGADVNPESVYCHKCGLRVDGTDETSPGEDVAEKEAATGSPPTGKERFSQRFATAQPDARDRDDDEELELWQGGYSSKAMFGSWIVAGVLTVVGIIAGVILLPAGFFPWLIVLGLIVAMWIFLLGKLTYRRMAVKYRLTSQRFIHEFGVLSRTTDRIEVIDMDDITFKQGLVERMVNVGTIFITSSDRTHPEIVLAGIDNVGEVSHLLDNARRKERIRRGVHIESI